MIKKFRGAKSDYIFPKTRWKENYPKEHTDAHAQTIK